jgi:hypothetical protein
MIELNKEYFETPYYFYLKERDDKVSVYYSVSDNIVESRKNDDVVEIEKDVLDDVKKMISKIMKSDKKISKTQIKKLLGSKKKKNGEIDELVDPDGSFIGSNIPILNQRNLAKKTMDQTVRMTKSNVWPFTRVYYGESEEEQDNTISEIDQSESFGFEETEDAPTYDVANKILKKMDIEDPIERDERLKRLGFDRKLDKQLKKEKKKGKCVNCFTKRRLSEIERQKMVKMIDEILLTKKSKDKEMVKKIGDEQKEDKPVYKIILRNLDAVKKLADKEDIDINNLVKYLKKGE